MKNFFYSIQFFAGGGNPFITTIFIEKVLFEFLFFLYLDFFLFSRQVLIRQTAHPLSTPGLFNAHKSRVWLQPVLASSLDRFILIFSLQDRGLGHDEVVDFNNSLRSDY